MLPVASLWALHAMDLLVAYVRTLALMWVPIEATYEALDAYAINLYILRDTSIPHHLLHEPRRPAIQPVLPQHVVHLAPHPQHAVHAEGAAPVGVEPRGDGGGGGDVTVAACARGGEGDGDGADGGGLRALQLREAADPEAARGRAEAEADRVEDVGLACEGATLFITDPNGDRWRHARVKSSLRVDPLLTCTHARTAGKRTQSMTPPHN